MTTIVSSHPRVLAMRFLACFVMLFAFASAAENDVKSFNIPADSAEKALRVFSAQAGVQVVFPTETVKGIKTNAVKGDIPASVALDRLLSGTELVAVKDSKSGALTVRREASVEQAEKNGASRPSSERAAGETKDGAIVLDTFEVLGKKSLNMDVRRTKDDVRPYVIFERSSIEQFGARNLEDFLRARLPMNTQGATNGQGANSNGNISQINLRGLGANQTLILVDGHRTARPSNISGPFQSDLNGIPLSAVERIEILPTTASGIYGGSATGGVINIILRRDYSGSEVKVSYENTFEGDAAISSIDVSTGFNLEGGKTHVLMAAHWSDANMLMTRDRDLVQRGRRTILTNNPSTFTATTIPNPILGATPNIRSVNGSPLFGPGTSFFTSVPVGYAGGGGLAPLQTNAGRYNLDLADSAQQFGGGRDGLLNAPKVESLMMTVRRELSKNIQGFLELSATNNNGRFPSSQTSSSYTVAASAPNNPFGQAVRVSVPTAAGDGTLVSQNKQRRIVAGLIVDLPGSWGAEADYTWDRSSLYFATPNPLSGAEAALISNGTIDVLRDTIRFPIDLAPFFVPSINTPFPTTLRDATLRLSGDLGKLPAGPIAVRMLAEHQKEYFGEGISFQGVAAGNQFVPSRSQTVNSAYVEATIPIVRQTNSFWAVQELELNVAGRNDRYSVEGATRSIPVGSSIPIERIKNKLSSTDASIGLRWVLSPDVMVRTSYGTGFLPPSVVQVVPTAPTSQSVTDPRRGGASTIVQVVGGGNPTLRPEQSESFSSGIVFTPRFQPKLRVAVDYTRINKTDNITSLSAQSHVDNEALLAGRVVRGAVPPNDAFGVGPITAVNNSSINVAHAMAEAYDVTIDYRIETKSLGAFSLFSIATWQTHSRTQLLPTSAVVENLGVTSSFPTKVRANAGLSWEYSDWAVGWSTSYIHSYRVSNSAATQLSQGSPKVPGQIYHDLFVRYTYKTSEQNRKETRGILSAARISKIEIQLGIKNLMNAAPPLDAGAGPYFYSRFGDPRLRSYFLSLRTSF